MGNVLRQWWVLVLRALGGRLAQALGDLSPISDDEIHQLGRDCWSLQSTRVAPRLATAYNRVADCRKRVAPMEGQQAQRPLSGVTSPARLSHPDDQGARATMTYDDVKGGLG
jgi:hypothetical protein